MGQEGRQLFQIPVKGQGPRPRRLFEAGLGPAHQQQGFFPRRHRQKAVHQDPGVIQEVRGLADEGQAQTLRGQGLLQDG